ncbi:MAG: hypothetical protein HRT65_15405 [Flavobacteriaceae bacterium]|nr:hypothetical protein [Flavobacteriaceae bacterium]
MKKLKYYPNVWVSYPFSMELYAHAEKEARSQQAERSETKKEKKPKFKLALGW